MTVLVALFGYLDSLQPEAEETYFWGNSNFMFLRNTKKRDVHKAGCCWQLFYMKLVGLEKNIVQHDGCSHRMFGMLAYI